MKPNTVILGWPNSWRKKEDEINNRVFVDAIRSAGAGKMALLVPKGIQRFPESGDSVKVVFQLVKLYKYVQTHFYLDIYFNVFWNIWKAEKQKVTNSKDTISTALPLGTAIVT